MITLTDWLAIHRVRDDEMLARAAGAEPRDFIASLQRGYWVFDLARLLYATEEELERVSLAIAWRGIHRYAAPALECLKRREDAARLIAADSATVEAIAAGIEVENEDAHDAVFCARAAFDCLGSEWCLITVADAAYFYGYLVGGEAEAEKARDEEMLRAADDVRAAFPWLIERLEAAVRVHD